MNSEGVFTIKSTTKNIPITQVQAPRERPPARLEKDQTGAINFQLHPRRRAITSLKLEIQAHQVQLRSKRGKQRRKRNPSSGTATNMQKEIIAPKNLLHRGAHRHHPTTTATRRTRCAATTATTTANHNTTSFGSHVKKKKKSKRRKMNDGARHREDGTYSANTGASQ